MRMTVTHTRFGNLEKKNGMIPADKGLTMYCSRESIKTQLAKKLVPKDLEISMSERAE